MSVAFTKEDSAETAAETMLPDRPISGAANLVTERGLKALQLHFDQARAAHDAASAIEDINERRRQAAAPLRDLRYYAERLRTAQLVSHPNSATTLAFGHSVSYRRDDGPKMTYRVVGEDEADPSTGSISYLSPVAQRLMGKSVGDVVEFGEAELEIVAIS